MDNLEYLIALDVGENTKAVAGSLAPESPPPVDISMTSANNAIGSEEVSLVDDEDWVEGDVYLISSDGVRFHVHKTLLVSSSPVFSDMLNLPNSEGDKVLQLTDPDFESADIVRLFLSLFLSDHFDGTLQQLVQLSWRPFAKTLQRLLTFVDKYDSELGVRMLRVFGSDVVLRRKSAPGQMIIFAALTNDLGLFSFLIHSYGGIIWGNYDETKVLGVATRKASIWSMAHAPYHYVALFPHPYQWALSRAMLFAKPDETAKFSHKFVEVVTAVLEEEENPFLPMFAEPHMEGYKPPKTEGTTPSS